MANGPQYTANELRIVRKLWNTTPASVIGDQLGRSKNSVIGVAWRLGLARVRPALPGKHVWTDQEIALLRKHANAAPSEIRHLFPGRTLMALQKKKREYCGPLKYRPQASIPHNKRKRLRVERVSLFIVSPHQCQWLHGERGSFIQCDAPAVRRNPDRPAVWCREHYGVVYTQSQEQAA